MKPDLSKAYNCISALSVLFVIGIAVLANLLFGRLPSSLTAADLSGDGLYSLGEETKTVLAALDQETVIYWLTEKGKENTQIEYLLERYQEESPFIRTEIIDPVVYPDFAAAYTDAEIHDNSLLAVMGGRGRLIDYYELFTADYGTYGDGVVDTVFDGENRLTSAIAVLSKAYESTAYLISGHGEAELSDALKSGLAAENYQLKQLKLLTEKKIPEDADLLILADPGRDLGAEEGAAIRSWLEKGGSILGFVSFREEKMPVVEDLLSACGLRKSGGIVFEGDSGSYYSSYPMYLLPQIRQHEVTASLLRGGYPVVVPNSEGFLQTGEPAVSVLLESSERSYSKAAGYDILTAAREEGDLAGPFIIAAATAAGKTPEGESRAVWVASGRFLSEDADAIVSGANTEFVKNACAWLTGREQSLNIRSKYLTSGRLAVSGRTKMLLGIVLLGVIPGIFALAGVVISYRRRRR